jgi:hypothetical protein
MAPAKNLNTRGLWGVIRQHWWRNKMTGGVALQEEVAQWWCMMALMDEVQWGGSWELRLATVDLLTLRTRRIREWVRLSLVTPRRKGKNRGVAVTEEEKWVGGGFVGTRSCGS